MKKNTEISAVMFTDWRYCRFESSGMLRRIDR